MLYVALVIAIGFYGALYFLWSAMEPHLAQPTAGLLWLRTLVFHVPEPNTLVLLKELILLTVLYLTADFVVASVRRWLRRKPKKSFASSNYAPPPAESEPLLAQWAGNEAERA